MLSIIGEALFTAVCRRQHHDDRRDDWSDRFVPPNRREDDRNRFSTHRDLFW